ncbi:MAG: hypothetical protein DMD36_11945, partial [Gemmatimonadetes bacterium]
MKRLLVTTWIGAAGLFTLLLVPLQGCTNLDEIPSSTITPGTFFANKAEVLAGLAGVYAQLRGAFPGYCCAYYVLSEISTDELVVPTRGQDWYDNGRWLEIHRQTWTANSPSGLQDINSAWVNDFTGIADANVVLAALENRTVMDPAQQGIVVAELRALRAFYYYQLMDLFGGVPVVTTTEVQPRARASRDSVFKFIESELLAARPDLPAKWGDADRGRVSKGAVDAILASMYINAGVFTKDAAGAGGINATGYNSCSGVTVSGGLDACQAAVNRADSIINSGVYQLAPTFTQNFTADNYLSPENIFVVKFINQDGMGFPLLQATLHYYQFTPGPWNGFATLANTYYTFDTLNDRRVNIFLRGPQNNLETGAPVCQRPGCDKGAPRLVFTPAISDVTQATEGEGLRIYKWPYDPKHIAQNNGNDFTYFRLAEMYLIKAEAELAGATGTPDPLTLLKAVRARSFPSGDTLSAVTPAAILRERLFELTFETKRRQDLIRFGQYTQPWQFK